MRLYVGNIPWSAMQDALTEHFSFYGPISDVRIITDRESGRSRGFGFVTFDDDEDGEEAIREANGSDFMGRTLRVSEAQEKPRRTDNGSQRRDTRQDPAPQGTRKRRSRYEDRSYNER